MLLPTLSFIKKLYIYIYLIQRSNMFYKLGVSKHV